MDGGGRSGAKNERAWPRGIFVDEVEGRDSSENSLAPSRRVERRVVHPTSPPVLALPSHDHEKKRKRGRGRDKDTGIVFYPRLARRLRPQLA